MRRKKQELNLHRNSSNNKPSVSFIPYLCVYFSIVVAELESVCWKQEFSFLLRQKQTTLVLLFLKSGKSLIKLHQSVVKIDEWVWYAFVTL